MKADLFGRVTGVFAEKARPRQAPFDSHGEERTQKPIIVSIPDLPSESVTLTGLIYIASLRR